MFESWIKDARYAARRLRRRPLYTGLAVLTLALGAGGTAAIYSITQTLLLDPLPIVREDEIGRFWLHDSWTEAEFLHVGAFDTKGWRTDFHRHRPKIS